MTDVNPDLADYWLILAGSGRVDAPSASLAPLASCSVCAILECGFPRSGVACTFAREGLLAQVQRLMSIRQQKGEARGQMTEIQKKVDHLGCKERPLLAQNSSSCE